MKIKWRYRDPLLVEQVGGKLTIERLTEDRPWYALSGSGELVEGPFASLAEAQSWAERWLKDLALLAEVRQAREAAAQGVAEAAQLLGEALRLEKRMAEQAERHAPGRTDGGGSPMRGEDPRAFLVALSGYAAWQRGAHRWPAHYFPVVLESGQRKVEQSAPVNAVSEYPVE